MGTTCTSWDQLRQFGILRGSDLTSKYSVRESYRLSFQDGCDKEATILNRVVTLGWNENGFRTVTIEPDKRHVEIILKELNLNGEKAKSAVTPGVRLTDPEIDKRKICPRFRGNDHHRTELA